MKWDKIKVRVARDVRYEIINSPAHWCGLLADAIYSDTAIDFIRHREDERSGIRAIEEAADKAYDVIMHWDIRQVGKLRELFPNYFPQSLANSNLTADMDDDGCWCVI